MARDSTWLGHRGAGNQAHVWGLRTTDETGQVLPSHFAISSAGPRIVIDVRGATYPITVDPTWASSATPEATLGSAQGTDDTDFGFSVALSADDTTALVGAYGYNPTGSEPYEDQGAVYVYHVTSASEWVTSSTPTATLTTSGLDGQTGFLNFGYSVALSADGTTALIGSPGTATTTNAAYIYQVASESDWVSTSTPTATLYDGSGFNDGFGKSVALSSDGTTALIGAPQGDADPYPYVGDAYVFHVASETDWTNTATPTATLTNNDAIDDQLGTTVALSSNGATALVGSQDGNAYIYEATSASAWASSATPSATLNNGGLDGQFGYSLALSADGTTALIGAPSANIGSADGAAYVFEVAALNDWATNPAPVSVLSNGVTTDDYFANSVSLSADGTTALIGAYDVGSDSGAAYVFSVESESAWSSNLTPSPTAALTNSVDETDDSFGSTALLSSRRHHGADHLAGQWALHRSQRHVSRARVNRERLGDEFLNDGTPHRHRQHARQYAGLLRGDFGRRHDCRGWLRVAIRPSGGRRHEYGLRISRVIGGNVVFERGFGRGTDE